MNNILHNMGSVLVCTIGVRMINAPDRFFPLEILSNSRHTVLAFFFEGRKLPLSRILPSLLLLKIINLIIDSSIPKSNLFH